jgi:hypothetical protein
VCRTQIQGVRQLNGSEHKLSAYINQQVTYATRVRMTGSSSAWGAFAALFTWTSFISGTNGSGTVGMTPNPTFRFSSHFNTSNPNYGGTVTCLTAQPTSWTDFRVTIFYSKSETAGWVEIERKDSNASTWSDVLFTIPGGAQIKRVRSRTLGESLAGDNNRFGLYSQRAFNGQGCLSRCIITNGVNSKTEAANLLGGGTSEPPPPPAGPPPPPAISLKAGTAVDGQYTVIMGAVQNPRVGDLKQIYINDSTAPPSRADIPLGTTEVTITGRTNGVEDVVRSSAGQPGSYGAWTPDAQVLRVTPQATDVPPPPPPDFDTVWALGDGAGINVPGAAAVKAFLLAQSPIDHFIYLGDVYENGTAAEMNNAGNPTAYHQMYGSIATKTIPAIQNHDVETSGGQPFFDYWNAQRPGFLDIHGCSETITAQGWQILHVNTEVFPGQTIPNSTSAAAVLAWLEDRLAAVEGRKKIIVAGAGRWSADVRSGYGDDANLDPIWDLIANRAMFWLHGNNHVYWRLSPVDTVVSVAAGTGGRDHNDMNTADARVQGFDDTRYGAAKFVLRADRAEVSFVSTDGVVRDSFTYTVPATEPTPPPDVPVPGLIQRPNFDVNPGASAPWGRTLSSSYWENVNSEVQSDFPASSPLLSSGNVITASAAGRVLELAFTTITRPAEGFGSSTLYMHVNKTGSLGLQVRLRNAAGGALQLIGQVVGDVAQARQTYAFPIPVARTATQAQIDAMAVELTTVAPSAGVPVSGQIWISEIWIEHTEVSTEPPPPVEDDITVSTHTVNFGVTLLGETPAVRTVTLSSTGPVDFTVTDNSPWLTIDPTSGTT